MRWEEDLTRDIREGPERDNTDKFFETVDWHVYLHGPLPFGEVSQCNRDAITTRFLKIRDQCKAILEIGIYRNGEESTTTCFIDNKKSDTIYLGVDIGDRSQINNSSNNVYTLQEDSSNIDKVLTYARSLGIEKFDFIFIDGDHSLSQVLKDWEYTAYLSDNGIVGMHDTSYHPGPTRFMSHLRTDKWNVEVNVCPCDNGVGFAWKKI
jgi:hypothetical protein